MRRSSGFSMIELMIAVAIASILLALGVPSFQSFIRNAKVRTAAESLQSGLSLARTEALRRNERVTLWMVNGITATCALSNTGTAWVVSLDSPASSCSTASSDTAVPRLIQSREANEGSSGVAVTALDSANAAASCVTFNGFGRVETTCTGGASPLTRITVVSTAGGTRTLELRVVLGGSIRMCDPSSSTGDASSC